jgi:predicted  nucleic acid-binding Zn-ribbon protein
MAESNTVKIIRLETQMTSVEEKVDKVDKKLDSLISKLDMVTTVNNELLILKSNYLGVEQKLQNLEKDIKERTKSLIRQRWMQNSLSAILGIVLTFLVSFFLTNVGK